MIFAQKFVHDFRLIVAGLDPCYLDSNPPFAFVRFGDGEAAIMRGRRHLAKSDGWEWPAGPDWQTCVKNSLPWRLVDSLICREPGWHVGISSFVHHPGDHQYLAGLIDLFGGVRNEQVTFAEVFNFANYSRWLDVWNGLKDRGRVQLCCPSGLYPIPVNAMHCVAGTGNADYRYVADWMIGDSKKGDRSPILVAAGPLANVIIHDYWLRCPPEHRRVIIDVGSAISETIHGRKVRHFQNPRSAKFKWQPRFWPEG